MAAPRTIWGGVYWIFVPTQNKVVIASNWLCDCVAISIHLILKEHISLSSKFCFAKPLRHGSLRWPGPILFVTLVNGLAKTTSGIGVLKIHHVQP
jgi:hypothetical protein